jgi:hypothetical protein
MLSRFPAGSVLPTFGNRCSQKRFGAITEAFYLSATIALKMGSLFEV